MMLPLTRFGFMFVAVTSITTCTVRSAGSSV
jgi:hypothetical protein